MLNQLAEACIDPEATAFHLFKVCIEADVLTSCTTCEHVFPIVHVKFLQIIAK